MKVWNSPQTSKPFLEPQFAAAFHGIELCFLLLSEFLADKRSYVAKRPRIERVVGDICVQCKLLTEIVDSELEEDCVNGERLSLTQSFPFPGAPPTADRVSFSPGINRCIASVERCLPNCTPWERNSLIKTIINISNTFFGSFQRWTVGLGIEWMLNELRGMVGLDPLPFATDLFLDYEKLVRPEVVETTLTEEQYLYPEDFFFRSIHLGTECWAFIALRRLSSSKILAEQGYWDTAAARIHQISRILDYLGDHVMMLTQMNLSDYLMLKVELEGTSGEGSLQVKSLRQCIRDLLKPLDSCSKALAKAQIDELNDSVPHDFDEEDYLTLIYQNPDKKSHRPLYTYAKSLEDVESSLCHFFYQHFCLAQNVIGSDARGTMRLPVQALKRTYEKSIFPELDRIRSHLGVIVERERSSVKGRMMNDIMQKYAKTLALDPEGRTLSNGLQTHDSKSSTLGQCPFHSSKQMAHFSKSKNDSKENSFENALGNLYSWKNSSPKVAEEFRKLVKSLNLPDHPILKDELGGPLAFVDHAWGKVAPKVLRDSLDSLQSLYLLGNPTWDTFFEKIIPEASQSIGKLLSIPTGMAQVHFGSNSHELIVRLLSSYLLGNVSKTDKQASFRVLTSDCEFVSISRQLNRLVEEATVDWQTVAAEPTQSFPQRIMESVLEAQNIHKPFSIIYVSQVTYLRQQTLIPDVNSFVCDLHDVIDKENTGDHLPLVIIDGYHGFMAFPTDLSKSADKCCYVGGLIKHAGCGANAAFLTLPKCWHNLRPTLTGWLADPSVLVPGSQGFEPGVPTGYHEGMMLQGGTPSYILPLIVFNRLQKAWAEAEPVQISIEKIHAYVLKLHDRFLEQLPPHGTIGITQQTLVVPLEPTKYRSHTLVFEQPSSKDAKELSEHFRENGLLVDCRKNCVRIGFGPYHTSDQVDALIQACNICTKSFSV